MFARRLLKLQPLTQQCIRFVSSNNNRPSSLSPSPRKRRLRFLTREIRHEEPREPPIDLIEPEEDEVPEPGLLPLSIYEALYRKPTRSPTEDAIESAIVDDLPLPPTKNYDEEPPIRDLRADDELSGWLNSALVKAFGPPETEVLDPPEVLILSPMPRSLLPSDFYRLAAQGTQIDGWAKGLQKVIQSRHPHSHEPREQFFLLFESRSSAHAYLENLRFLHERALDALHPAFHPENSPQLYASSYQKPPPSSGHTFYADNIDGYRANPDIYLEDPNNPVSLFPSRERINSYALLPPTTQLTAVMIRQDSLLNQIHMKTLHHPGLVPYGMQRYLTSHHKNPPQPDDNRVLVKIRGGWVTKDHLYDLILLDGKERNLDWELELFENDIDPESESEEFQPVKRKGNREWNTIHGLKYAEKNTKPRKTEKEAELEEVEQGMKYQEEKEKEDRDIVGYSRYVISFRTPVEAKRFVRAWHQKWVEDGRTDRIVKIHCTALF
ncbi:hypothetical protein QBC38DRAFT_466538 [Podospora fimiseda]|uniref:Uncharacterized protein n=1 Tax=Podospora fimiseda TaxID=252190 RepID=A0AAN7H141_9PEZI|nr:hypothetical protein QBC38DRAFT_466538 [Podospora fimiseda]